MLKNHFLFAALAWAFFVGAASSAPRGGFHGGAGRGMTGSMRMHSRPTSSTGSVSGFRGGAVKTLGVNPRMPLARVPTTVNPIPNTVATVPANRFNLNSGIPQVNAFSGSMFNQASTFHSLPGVQPAINFGTNLNLFPFHHHHHFPYWPYFYGNYGYLNYPYASSYLPYDYTGLGAYGNPYANPYVNYSPASGGDYAATPRPQTQPPVAQATFQATTGPANNTARIEVLVPDPKAEVWYNGVKTPEVGEKRFFTTAPMEPGATYWFTVKATWTDGAQTNTVQRNVNVSAGARVVVEFSKGPVRVSNSY